MKYIVCYSLYGEQDRGSWTECKSSSEVLDTVRWLCDKHGLKEDDFRIIPMDGVKEETVAAIRAKVTPLPGTAILYGNPQVREFCPEWFKGLPETLMDTLTKPWYNNADHYRRTLDALETHLPGVNDQFFGKTPEKAVEMWQSFCDYRTAYTSTVKQGAPVTTGSIRYVWLAEILSLLTGKPWVSSLLKANDDPGVSEFQFCIYRRDLWTDEMLTNLEKMYFSGACDEELAAAIECRQVLENPVQEESKEYPDELSLTCPHCGHTFMGGASEDNLGWHSMCPACEQSFDIDLPKEASESEPEEKPQEKVVVFRSSGGRYIDFIAAVENYDSHFDAAAEEGVDQWNESDDEYCEVMLKHLRSKGYRLRLLDYETFRAFGD